MATVLIVEDDFDIADLLRLILEDDAHSVAIATSSDIAVDEARALRPDVILLDMMMPPPDGWEVARRLRADAQLAAIPIVVMTALHAAEQRAAEIDTPHVLPKPFDAWHVLDLVQRLTTVAA